MSVETANVWLRSRAPAVAQRIRGLQVSRLPSGGYAPLTHAGRVFEFSHSQRLLTHGQHEEWLVFVDASRG